MSRDTNEFADEPAIPGLADAFLTFAQVAARVLGARDAPTFVSRAAWPQRWRRVGDEEFVPLIRPVWDCNIAEVWQVLDSSGATAPVVNALGAVPKIRRQLDRVVGSANSKRSVRVWDLLITLYLGPIFEAAGGYEVDPSVARSCYVELESALLADCVLARQVLPILGFDSTGAVESPFEGVQVRQLTDRELSRLIDMSALPVARYDAQVRVPRSWRWALVADVQLARLVEGEVPTTPTPQEVNLSDYEESFLAAARLVGGGSVVPGPVVHFEEQTSLVPNAGGWHGVRPTPGTLDPERPCLVRDPQALTTLWQRLESSPSSRIRVASRRLLDAGRRFRAEDALLDLAIAAEALLGGDATTEMAYRFALHGALLVTVDGRSKRELRSFLRHVYNVRSKVVHGDKVPKLVRLDGSTAQMPDVVHDLEVIVSVALETLLAAEASGVPIKVDELVDRLLN